MDFIPDNNSPTPSLSDELDIPLAQRKTMTTLLPDDCRWPIGEPQAEGFHFCGKHKQAGHPYCEFHVRCAKQPSRPRNVLYRPRDTA
jgi:GcrA cell cycle regulator